MIMSGGQYELKRVADAGNLKSQSGLELSVIDHYNGTVRSVKTLSAENPSSHLWHWRLGYQTKSSHQPAACRSTPCSWMKDSGRWIRIPLQQAYDALASLTNGHRLVGIISHVDSLKEKIDKQIVVKKGITGGSHAALSVM